MNSFSKHKDQYNILQCIHSVNMKTGVIEALHDFKYPSNFECNKECRFTYNSSTSEIFIATEDMEIIKVNLKNKKWDYCGDGPSEALPFDNCMFIKRNDIHMICPYYVDGPGQNSLKSNIESLNYLIFDEEQRVFANVGTYRKEPLIFDFWDEHIVLPLVASPQDSVLLINKASMNITEFKGDAVKHVSLVATPPPPHQDDKVYKASIPAQDAWNGAVITNDNKIALIFELWKAPNCEFINIIDLEKKTVRKSGIKSPSVQPFITSSGPHQGHPISVYYFQPLIMPNRNEASLTVNGYYRKSRKENKLIPTVPVQILKLIVVFYITERIFLLHTFNKRFCYAVLRMDQILNSDYKDETQIKFQYASK